MNDTKFRPEFASHILNDAGIEKAQSIGAAFGSLLTFVEQHVPAGRELAIVKTKLEEACFFAKKGMAIQADNQA